MIVLPQQKIPPTEIDPKFLILFGKPKSGKTTMVSMLENNLIVDLEGGSLFLEALAIQARTTNDLFEIATEIKKKNTEINGHVYKYITIDNASILEEMSLPYAAKLYRQTALGSKWQGNDVRQLPKGAGWFYVWEAVKGIISMFRSLCDTLILVGHTKDKTINLEGQEITEMQLDLAGKLSDIICGRADAIAYVYRKGNKTIFSFKGGENSVKEARAKHLRGNEIVIGESDENNNIKADWSKIFKELEKEKKDGI